MVWVGPWIQDCLGTDLVSRHRTLGLLTETIGKSDTANAGRSNRERRSVIGGVEASMLRRQRGQVAREYSGAENKLPVPGDNPAIHPHRPNSATTSMAPHSGAARIPTCLNSICISRQSGASYVPLYRLTGRFY